MMRYQKSCIPFFLLVLIFISVKTLSQHVVKKRKPDFSVKAASKTPWAGGPAGYHGVKYHIELSSVYSPETIHPDTIWSGEKCFPLVYKDSSTIQYHSFNTSVEKEKKRTVFKINVEERYIEERNSPDPEKKDLAEPSFLPFAYKGALLLSYTKKGKRKYFILKTIKQNPLLAYP